MAAHAVLAESQVEARLESQLYTSSSELIAAAVEDAVRALDTGRIDGSEVQDVDHIWSFCHFQLSSCTETYIRGLEGGPQWLEQTVLQLRWVVSGALVGAWMLTEPAGVATVD